MRCYRKILRFSYKDHVTNEEVRAKIQQAIGTHEDLLTIEKRRKLKWYGRITRSSGLAKTILQGTVKSGKRQGRQRKRWKDNIREWTGLEFTKFQRAEEDRGKWKILVAKSSVVPHRPSRLRDRWCWWWWKQNRGKADRTIFTTDLRLHRISIFTGLFSVKSKSNNNLVNTPETQHLREDSYVWIHQRINRWFCFPQRNGDTSFPVSRKT